MHFAPSTTKNAKAHWRSCSFMLRNALASSICSFPQTLSIRIIIQTLYLVIYQLNNILKKNHHGGLWDQVLPGIFSLVDWQHSDHANIYTCSQSRTLYTFYFFFKKALYTYFEKEIYTKLIVLATLLISGNIISFSCRRGFI